MSDSGSWVTMYYKFRDCTDAELAHVSDDKISHYRLQLHSVSLVARFFFLLTLKLLTKTGDGEALQLFFWANFSNFSIKFDDQCNIL